LIEEESTELENENWEAMKEALNKVKNRYADYMYVLEKRPKL
jgi:hypothetical protein